MRISVIAATDPNGLIGHGLELPWHIPADLKRFKAITMGRPLIMGRKTHESIGRPLPGRKNIVLTRTEDYQAEGCSVVNTLDEALLEASPADEVFVIGGAEIYRFRTRGSVIVPRRRVADDVDRVQSGG